MRHPEFLFRRIFPACLSWAVLWAAAEAAVPPDYDITIQNARNGNPAIAADKLQNWLGADPDNLRILYDLVAVLGMAGQDEFAMRYYPRVVRDGVPPYAIKAMADSARRVGRFDEASTAYRLLLRTTLDDAEAHAGLAYTWLEQGRSDEALSYVEQHLPYAPSAYVRRDLPLVIALADVRERRQEWLDAAQAYQEALRLEPGFRYAIRGQVFALNRARLSPLAKRLAQRQPDVFTPEEMRQLEQDTAARITLFGESHAGIGDGLPRFGTTDVALQINHDVVARFGEKSTTQFDRLVALRDRMQMREAADLYESMQKQDLVVPPYVKAAAADAYLYLERPEIARDLYYAAIEESRKAGDNDVPGWKIGLMYAYVEAEQHDEAQALADRETAGTPRLIYAGVTGIEQPNEEYSQASLMSARTRMYASRLDEAEGQFAELRQRAPFNADVRASSASLLSAREKPRAALDEFTLLQVDEPKSIDAAVGRGEMLLALNQFDEAHQVLGTLVESHPENKAVQNFARKLDYHDGLLLQVDTTLGRGGSTAGAESVLEAKLYSSPLRGSIGEPFRVFAHTSYAEGDVRDASTYSRTRIGAGLDYRVRDFSVEGEVNHALSDPSVSGIALTLTWNLSDSWRADVFVDTNVNDLPAVAFQNGVTAKRIGASVVWVDNESRSIGLTASRAHYSDDNNRDAARLWWNERWYSGPVFKFDTSLGYYTSSNSEADRVYFSPSRDRELSLALGGEWLTWRRYHQSFSQRVTVTAGSYRQEGQGSGPLGDLRYEHVWSDEDHVNLHYGVGYGFHPYDGNREYRRYGFLGLNWAIK